MTVGSFPLINYISPILNLQWGHPRSSIIDNPKPNIINIGIGLCPPLMGTFDYPPPSSDVKFISAIPDWPKVEIFQVSSFPTTYFDDPWTIPSPSSRMEGIWHHGMDMPLSMTEVVYYRIQQACTDLDMTPTQELDPVLKPT
jgi:hypothetical protein